MSGCNDCKDGKLCHYHERHQPKKYVLKRTPLKPSNKKIKPRSDKRAKIDRVYNARVKVWKVENPLCMARLDGCTIATEHCHHIEPRTEKNLLIEENWMPVCPPCHRKITDDSKDANEKGLSKSRLKN